MTSLQITSLFRSELPDGPVLAPDTLPAPDSNCLIAATTDIEAVMVWLASSRKSGSTFRAYKKEADRFLLWCREIAGKRMADLKMEDALAYQAFVKSPPPSWCSQLRVGRDSPDWRPFRGPLADPAHDYMLSILRSLFHFLIDAGYLQKNPFALIQKEGVTGQRLGAGKVLSPVQVEAIKTYIAQMPSDTPNQIKEKARSEWIFGLVFTTGIRRSEMLPPNGMSSFAPEMDENGQVEWWLTVIGKGKKAREIPVPESVIELLRRYRTAHELTPLPGRNEHDGLVLNIRNDKGITHADSIYEAFTDICKGAADLIKETNPFEAARLSEATPHWMRHTSATLQLQAGADIHDVQANLGHSSVATTSTYLQSERRRRHRGMKLNW